MKNKMILVAVTILLAFAGSANAQGYGHRGNRDGNGGGHYAGGYNRGYDRGGYGYGNRGYNHGYDRGYYGRGYYRPAPAYGYYAPGYCEPGVAVYPQVVPAPAYAYRRPGYYVHPRPFFRGPRVRVNIGF